MKRILQSFFLFLFLISAIAASAQDRTVSGTVKAQEDSYPLPGVSVKANGTEIGTQTDVNGNFSLRVPSTTKTLTFSYIGFKSITLNINANNTMNVLLETDSKQLGEVIVTGALGIKRAAKENGYAETNISSKELNQASVINIANGLTAKVSGLQINTINNGIDPGLRIVLRGNRSINGNNTALVVLDGIPVPSSTLASINPNDIESVNVLKGASAAALYGSEASNGALVVTTKKATTNGKPVIKYSNSSQLQTVAYLPDIQTTYGQYGGEPAPDLDPLTGFAKYVPYENQLFGPKYDGSNVDFGPPLQDGTQQKGTYTSQGNQLKRFFETGRVIQNDISFAQGDKDNSFFLSYQNAYTKGIVPNDVSKRNAIRVGASKTYGNFKADFSLGYTNTDISTYFGGYDGSNLYANILQVPANIDIRSLKDPFGKFTNPNDYFSGYSINPYWVTSQSRINNRRDVLLANASANYAPTKWFDATYRISQNYGIYQQKRTQSEVIFSQYAINDPLGVGNRPSGYPSGKIPGQVSDYTQFGDGGTGYNRFQQDLLLNFKHTFFDDFKTNLLLGSTVWQQKYKFVSTGSNSLLIPNYYNVNAIGGVADASEGEALIRQIGVYGSLNIGYKDYAFLEVTGRNDFDSRLGKANRSFFYPSVKASFIFTDAISALKNNKIINYGKLRAAYSQVGQVNIGPYSLQNTYSVTSGYPYGSLGALSLGTTNNNPDLKPELVTEIEFGTELGFFDSRINLIATYFNQDSKNQTFSIVTSAATGFNRATINAGELQSKGFEFDLKGAVLTKQKNKVSLDLGGNLGIYNSEVKSLLSGGPQEFQISGASNNTFAIVGQPYPIIKGTDLLRDPQGRVIVSPTTGYPSINPTQQSFGRATPKYILGLNASVGYKFVTLSAVAEYRGGYSILNQVGSTLTFTGQSALSASAGRQRFIFPNSVTQNTDGTFTSNTSVPVRDGNYGFWQGNYYRANSTYVTSAAFWKLREVNLSFDLNQFIKNKKYIKGAFFSVNGRNLLLFKPKENTFADPEFSLDNSNAVGQTNSNQIPPTRIFGANLQITF
nr:SusC/RagA family TonB-linked outer membrane protein [Pseudopedobacter sp.]